MNILIVWFPCFGCTRIMIVAIYSFCAESLQSVVNELSRVESDGEVGANPTSAGVNPVSWSALETFSDL